MLLLCPQSGSFPSTTPLTQRINDQRLYKRQREDEPKQAVPLRHPKSRLLTCSTAGLAAPAWEQLLRDAPAPPDSFFLPFFQKTKGSSSATVGVTRPDVQSRHTQSGGKGQTNKFALSRETASWSSRDSSSRRHRTRASPVASDTICFCDREVLSIRPDAKEPEGPAAGSSPALRYRAFPMLHRHIHIL